MKFKAEENWEGSKAKVKLHEANTPFSLAMKRLRELKHLGPNDPITPDMLKDEWTVSSLERISGYPRGVLIKKIISEEN